MTKSYCGSTRIQQRATDKLKYRRKTVDIIMNLTYNQLTTDHQLTMANYRNTARDNNTVKHHNVQIENDRHTITDVL